MKEFWNERYSLEEYVYGKEPNQFFKSIIDKLKPGKILLPAEGEGRNAVYAAKKGWEVDAFDISEAGKEKALELAKANNVTFLYNISSVEDFILKPDSYDAVGLVYSHLIPTIRESFHKSLDSCLKSGGIVMLEAFNKKQLHRNTGGPKNLDMLYDLNMLKNDFASLEIELLEESTIEIYEGKFHSGISDVIRLIARKK